MRETVLCTHPLGLRLLPLLFLPQVFLFRPSSRPKREKITYSPTGTIEVIMDACELQRQKEDREALSTLRTFQVHLDVKITFGEDLIASPDQMIIVRELFIHPLKSKSYQFLQIDELHDSYRSKMMRNSIKRALKVSVIIIATAGGNLLPPLFFVREARYDPRWFYPLDKDTYKWCGEQHPYIESDWFKTDSAIHTIQQEVLDDRAVDIIYKHISYNMRRNPREKLINKEQGILLLLPRNFADQKVKSYTKGEDYNFEVAELPDAHIYTIDPFDYGIQECFNHNITQHINNLEFYSEEERNTVRQKLMIGQLAHDMISKPVVLRSFEDAGLWPVTFTHEDYSFRFKFADESTLHKRVLKDVLNA